MRKSTLTLLTLIFLLTGLLHAQGTDANQDYIKAVTTKNPNQRIQLLKDYLSKYVGQGTQYENFVYANLCTTPSAAISQEDRINYGEKAISLGGYDELTNFKLYITVSGLYIKNGKNLNKAKSYSLKAVQVAKAAKSKETERTNIARWNQFIGAGYYNHGQALEKANDPKGAVKAYINSFKILKNEQIIKSIRRLGKKLYDAKEFKASEEPFQLAAQVLKDYGSMTYYAKCLHRSGKKASALKYYKLSYSKQKSGDLAYNIGILLAGQIKSNPAAAEEAIQYLLDAAFLSKTNTKKAMDLAQGLFFNRAHKDLKYNEKVQELVSRGNKITDLSNSFNSKFGDKDEEDLTDTEKKEMETILASIETEKKAIDRLELETKAALEKFNQAIESAKKRLGIVQ